MKKKMRNSLRGLLAAFIFACLSVGVVAPAQAAVNCNNIVSDDARAFKSTSDIERAATEASRQVGAVVYVVTTKTFAPASSLDEFYQQTLAKCPAWQGRSADGSVVPKSNLLVLLMSLDERKVAIMYGDDWKKALDGNAGALRIQSQEMGPFFRGGDFAGGFVKGIESSQQAIYEYQNPAPEAPVTNIDNSEPTDFSGLWKVLGWTFGSIFFFAICVVGFMAFSSRKREREERAAAKQKAMAERDATSLILNGLNDEASAALRASRVAKYSKTGDDVARELKELAHQVKTQKSKAEDGMAAAKRSFGEYPEESLSVAQYAIMEGYYSQAYADAEKAKQAADRIDAICEQTDESLKALPGQLDSLGLRLHVYTTAADALVAEEYKFNRGDVDALHLLMMNAAAKGATLEALQDVNDAGEKMTELESSLSDFQQTITQQSASREELRGRLAAGREDLVMAAESFERISAMYASRSWESVQGNGTEATNRLNEAEREMEAADMAADMGEQRWDDVRKFVQQGNLLVDEAVSLLHSIISREENLAKAKATADQEIELAQSDIDKAAQYLDEFDADIRDSLEGDVAEARDLLDQARAELAKQMPDYLVVLDAALAANRKADVVFAEAQSEHEAAERLRHQAAAAVERAQITINKTDQFIGDHSSDVGHSAPKKLKLAENTLRSAIDATDTSSKLSLAEDALRQAQSAYSKAKSDFDDAEATREAERRRRRREREERDERERRDRDRSSTVIVAGGWGSSSSSSSSSSGSFGGGSSSGFGGFDGGGGGSSGSW